MDVLTQLAEGAISDEIAPALRLATAFEVATTPFGTSAGGFAFKLDRSTGLEVRTATTFGPSFAERAITSGAGQISFSVSLATATYDKLGKLPLDRMVLVTRDSPDPRLRATGTMSLVLSSETTVIQTITGATDNLDVGVAVPIVRVRLKGSAWEENAGIVRAVTQGSGISSGLGDLALIAKYRFFRFGGPPPKDTPLEPDPGGLALVTTLRLPTGSRENLRGLGVTRTLASLVFSAGTKRIRPHASIGYELWDKGIDVVSPFIEGITTARHSFQYAAGVEFEAAPKLTLVLDVLGRQLNGGGKIELQTRPVPNQPGVTLTEPVPLPEGVRKITLAPGLKWNLKGNFLLALNGLTSIADNGLYDRFTPVVGLDWTF